MNLQAYLRHFMTLRNIGMAHQAVWEDRYADEWRRLGKRFSDGRILPGRSRQVFYPAKRNHNMLKFSVKELN